MTRTLFVLAWLAGAMPASSQDQPPDLTPAQSKAAKLAGLAGFVNLSCPEIQTEKERFRAVIEGMRINPSDLEQGALRLRAESYIMAYQKDVPASCRQARELFGQQGTIIPGLFVAR